MTYFHHAALPSILRFFKGRSVSALGTMARPKKSSATCLSAEISCLIFSGVGLVRGMCLVWVCAFLDQFNLQCLGFLFVSLVSCLRCLFSSSQYFRFNLQQIYESCVFTTVLFAFLPHAQSFVEQHTALVKLIWERIICNSAVVQQA